MDKIEKTNQILFSELEELKKKYADLSNSHEEISKQLAKAEFDLIETRKELHCQNLVTEIASNTAFSLDQIIENIVKILSMAMQFPETSGASVELNGKSYRTPHFDQGAPKFSEKLFSLEKEIGKLEVSCSRNISDDSTEVFLNSEYVLLTSIARRIELIFDKTKTDQALQDSEELYRTIINTSPDSITIFDLEGKILMSSPRSLAMFGVLDEAEYIGHSVIEFIHPADQERAVMNMKRMLEKPLGSIEYKAIKRDGSTFDIEVNAEVFRDDYGNPSKILMITRDITERKAITEKLIKSEDTYRNLIETISDVIFEINLEGIITFLSPSAEKISQYKVDDLIGKSFFDLVHPDDRSKIANLFTDELHEKHNNLEYRLLLDEHTTRWIAVTSQFKYTDNLISGRTGILQDITDRKLAEEKLRKSEEAFRNMVENINDVVYEVDFKGVIQYVSPSIERYLGYNSEELIGKNIFEFIYDQDKKKVYESLMHLDRKDYSFMEYRYVSRNGDIRWVRTSTNPIYENGIIIGGRGVWIDHTETKLAQEKLYQSEARYRSFFEKINTVMILIDPDNGKIRDANPAACDFYGWQYSELCSKHISEINTLEYEELKQEMQSARREEHRHFFFKHRLANGQIRDVEVYTGPMNYSGETLLYSLVHDITERKQIEEDLRKSEEKYRNIFENIQDAYYEANMDGILTEISPSIVNLTQGYYTREALLGKSILDFYANPEIREVLITELFSAGSVNDFEISFKNGDGTVVPTAISSTIQYRPDGTPLKIIGSMRDITARRQAETALQKSEEKYRNLFYNSPQAFFILQDGIFIECNLVSEALFGCKRENIIGKTPGDLSPEYQPNGRISSEFANELIEQTLAKGINSFEWIHKRFDNTTFLAQLHFRTTEFEGKKVLLITMQDITLHREAEINLRKLSSAVEQSPVSIIITDLGGNIEYANPKACEITGYTSEELIGKNPRLLKSGETSALEYSQLWNRILSGKEWKGIFHNKRKNGELFWESSTLAPIQDTEGNITHYIAVKEDISDRIKMQFELLESQERFKQIAEQSQTVIWEVDKNGLFTYVNHISEAVWGYSPDELIGKMYFFELNPADTLEDFKKVAFSLINDQLTLKNFESPIVRKDGQIRWLSTNGVPIKDSTDILIGYRGAGYDITERRKMQLNLQESEERFRQIAIQSQTVIWELDTDAVFKHVNQVSLAVWGYTPDELIGKMHFYDLHPEESREEFTKLAYELAENHLSIVNLENPIKKKDGSIIWVTTNGVPVFDQSNNLVGYRGSDMDITERKRAEREMHKFRTISDNANYGTAITVHGGIFSYVNEAYAKMHGWEINDLIGKSVSVIHNEEQLNQLRHLLNNKESKGEFNAEEVWHLKKDGTPFPTLMNTLTIYDQNNQPEYRAATVIDITERKQIELENKRLTIAIEQSPVAMVTTDLSANIQYVSPAFHDITGYTPEEVVGKNIRILKSGKTNVDIYNDLWSTIKAGKTWQGELLNRKKDKSLYWESISITPIHDEKGQITSYLAIKQDISLRKNAEQEINELNTRLEQKIEERTSQLASSNSKLLSEIEERKIIEIALQSKTNELENFFNVTPDLLCIFNVSGDFIKVNKAWESILGFPVEVLANRNFIDFVHPDDIESTNESMLELKENHSTVNFVNRYRTNTNEYRFIEWNSVPQGEIIFSAARDITERKRSEDFEDELLALSSKLTGIPFAEIKPALNMALSKIGQFLGADRAYIFELNTSETTMCNTFEWCNEGISAEIDNLQDIPCDLLPEWMNVLRKHENIVIPSVIDLPESWKPEREILEPQGIQSLIVIPLLVDNNLIGFVGLDAVNKKRVYNPSEINNLKVWGSMIASLINNSRTEGLLEQTRQNYETFFNTIDDFLFVLDHDGKIIHVNNTIINRLGFLNDEIIDQSVLRLHPIERRDEAAKIIHDMLEGLTDYCQIPIISKSGKQIPVETKIKPGYWNGKPVIFGVSKDISLIKISEQKFSVAFQANSAMMSISNFENGKFIDVNNAYLETLAYSFDEIIGKTAKGLGIFIDQNLGLRIQNDLNNNNPIRKLEIQMRTKVGEMKTGLLSADSIYVGEIHCLLTVIIDITERKKAEDEIKLARQEADNANKAKSEFLSRMSHELRTPMNSILGFAQLMQMGELNPGQTKGINHIMTSGKHLLDLINEVLDISRIEAGRISLSMEPIQVNNVVLEMIDIVRPMAQTRNLKIELISSASNTVFVKADHQRLKQVIINLLNNAIKYNIEDGSIWIRIGLHQSEYSDIENVRISIIDTGLGINQQDISKLFTPFERIGADKTSTEGTGLGLAVVEKLMLAMGGSIGVDSVLGEGSTFWIELPKTEDPAELLKVNHDLSNMHSKASEEKGRILYIEDNSSNIELVEQLLAVQRPGIQLYTSMTGSNTVQLATDYRIDLILLDLNLPDIHGSEVLEQILHNESTKNIPVVIVSADAMPHQLEKLIKKGAKHYLAKPIDVSNLLKIVDNYMHD